MTARDPAGSEWVGLLSDGAPPPADERARPPAPRDGPRYRLGGELGAGAMGRVRVAYDAVLEREVAIKQVRATGDAAAEAALRREARVTAGLDHPGIIAVLDAGEDDDGAPFYAMRVVHGDSLADVVAAAPTPARRAALVRAVLQVAQALAYAHARGVVHRDLSPRNVRLGAHGEVVVMDWGLAARVDEAARGGVACGTPGYRAPELARGAPAGPTADVWSVGALLHLVVTGAPPGEHGAPARGLPAELRSLLARALAADPAARYPDAGALARDLAAYLDGGAVAAHRDRPWDRAARLARRHPGVLAAATMGVAGIAIVAVVLGTLADRRAADARRSRDDARRSRADAHASLREMVVDRAGEAVRADRRADAEALAARARALGADAAAAGIAAAFAAAPRVRVTPVAGEDGCRTLDVRGDGARLCVADGALWRVAAGDRRALDLAGGAPAAARFLADGGVVAVSAGVSENQVARFDRDLDVRGRHPIEGGGPALDEAGGWALVFASGTYVAVAPDGAARYVRPCPAGAVIRAAAALPSSSPEAPGAVVVCADGTLVTHGPGGIARTPVAELFARVPAVSAGAVVGDHLLVGGSDGRIAAVELATGALIHADASPVGPVARIAPAPGGDAIVVGSDGVAWWRVDAGAWRHVAPATVAADATAAGDRVLAYGAGAIEAWEVDARGATHRLATLGGLASAAWSADGARVAFGGGDGVVHVVDVATGRVARRRIDAHVVKAVAFGADGRTLAIGVATDTGLHALDVATGAPRDGAWRRDPSARVRRLAFLGPDEVLPLRYSPTLYAYDLRTGARRDVGALAAHPHDAAAPAAPGVVFALDTAGGVYRIDADGPTARRAAPGAIAIAASRDGAVLALVGDDGASIELRDAATDAPRARLAAPGARIEDAALDAGGRRLALGRLDGTVEIWDVAAGAPILAVRAHAGRAAAVAFSPDGCHLATAGWDAVARLFALPCR